MAYDDEADTAITTGVTVTVGLEESKDVQFDIFSSENTLNLTLDNELIGAKLEVYDMSGKVVLSQIVSSTNEQISYNLSKGIYVVRLFNNNKAISRKINL